MLRLLAAAVIMVLPVTISMAQHTGYAGQQDRDIKALSVHEVADLLAGRGMGLARPAELNHYPGPAHVLELKDRLGITPDQEAAVRAAFERMQAAAKPLGAELIQKERDLDQAFAGGSINSDTLRTVTAVIGGLQGRLRAVHLAAHIETKAILTGDQSRAYDALRGYGSGAAPAHHHHRQ